MTDATRLSQVLDALDARPVELAAAMGWSMPTYYSRISGESEWKASEIVKFTRLAQLSREERDSIFLQD
ncbi:MAG: hypothetical protein IKY91_02085 [Akkermansia sp.]|nr:hypothetical protein [Akkermansia sp.]